MISISRFDFIPELPENNRNVTKGNVIHYDTFKEFAEAELSIVKEGGKHEEYFVRGALSPFHRNDENMTNTQLLILDADVGTDDEPLNVINNLVSALNGADVEYCIYPSYSYTQTNQKCRCVIPTDKPFDKAGLKIYMPALINMLNKLDYNIKWVKEMGVMSQPWYLPRVESFDNDIPKPIYHAGEPLMLESLEAWAIAQEQKHIATITVVSNSEMEDIIIHQKDGLHEATNNLIWQLVKDNKTRPEIAIRELNRLYDLTPEDKRDKRYHDYRKDIERSVQGAIDKDEPADEIDDFGIVYTPAKYGHIPKPPGMLGELMELALDQASYRHPEVALASAIGLVAGIAGRKFNVNSQRGLGLNVYMLLAAGTGVGKESIKNFIQDNIPVPEGGTKSSFIGPHDFTAATGLIKQNLKNARCEISVMTEIAYVLESESGDKASKRRITLMLYTASGHRDVLHSTSFSSSDNSIPSLNSPCLSIIGESTPDKLIQNIMKDDSVSDGWLPRFSLFRVHTIDNEGNDDYRDTPDNIAQRILELVEVCQPIQSLASFECHMLNLYDVDLMHSHRKEWRTIQANIAESDPIKSAVASRLHVKALKYAALATVLNKRKDDPGCLIIDEPEWLWAKDMIKYEWDNISNFFQGAMSGSPLDDAFVHIIGKYILMGMEKNPKNKKMKLDMYSRKDRAIPIYRLRDVIGNKLSKFNTKYKDGIDIVMEYGIDRGYCTRERQYSNIMESHKKDCLIVTQGFYNRLSTL